jgi:hypothetical protein
MDEKQESGDTKGKPHQQQGVGPAKDVMGEVVQHLCAKREKEREGSRRCEETIEAEQSAETEELEARAAGKLKGAALGVGETKKRVSTAVEKHRKRLQRQRAGQNKLVRNLRELGVGRTNRTANLDVAKQPLSSKLLRMKKSPEIRRLLKSVWKEGITLACRNSDEDENAHIILIHRIAHEEPGTPAKNGTETKQVGRAAVRLREALVQTCLEKAEGYATGNPLRLFLIALAEGFAGELASEKRGLTDDEIKNALNGKVAASRNEKARDFFRTLELVLAFIYERADEIEFEGERRKEEAQKVEKRKESDAQRHRDARRRTKDGHPPPS